MRDQNNIFVTAITCIDGRIHEPINKWTKEMFEVEYVDMITWPGIEKVLSEANDGNSILKKNINAAIVKNSSQIIVITAHEHCSYNNTSEIDKINQLKASIKTVQSWGIEGIREVRGVYIREAWIPEEITLLQKESQNADLVANTTTPDNEKKTRNIKRMLSKIKGVIRVW